MTPTLTTATETNRIAAAHALVVDDEELPRAHLAHLLREAGVGTVDEAADGDACLSLCARDRIDWVFLDIRMPGLDGMAVAEALTVASIGGSRPEIVFVTGYEDYAVQAFAQAATDYLLKPVERSRLAVTLQRLSARSENQASAGTPADSLPPLAKLPIRTDYATRLVDLTDIIAAVARDKRVEVLTADAAYPTYYTLSGLEQRLPPEQFLRVHESWIVNLTEIVEVHSLGSQSYQLRLRHGTPLIPVSRRRLPLLQKRLGL
jgi:DNA-binding LytR/AlgR family response regulator